MNILRLKTRKILTLRDKLDILVKNKYIGLKPLDVTCHCIHNLIWNEVETDRVTF